MRRRRLLFKEMFCQEEHQGLCWDHQQVVVICTTSTQCLKITEKVSFNIASEASYVYILSGQKLIKNAINGRFGEFLKT